MDENLNSDNEPRKAQYMAEVIISGELFENICGTCGAYLAIEDHGKNCEWYEEDYLLIENK